MLILIREKKTPASIRYILKEPTSGLEREWMPSKDLPRDKIDETLTYVASLLEQDAIQYLAEINTQKTVIEQDDSLPPPSDMTLRQYGEFFMERKRVDIAEYTRNSWQGCLDFRIYPRMGKKLLRDITPGDLTDFFTSLKNEGLKHNSVLLYYTVLTSLFKTAYNRDDILRNPMDKVERPKPRKDELCDELPRSYPPEKIRYILECLHKEPLKWQVYILLMVDTGMRRGECCALTWDDFDFKENTVLIHSSACYTKEKSVYLTTTKNRKPRTVDVDPDVLLYVRFLYFEQLTEQKTISPYLFPHRLDPNKPMLPSSATRYFAKFGKRYEIEHLNPHRLRHSYASVAITNGADIASVSELLGHSDKAFTLRTYTQANPTSLKQASNIRRQAIKGKADYNTDQLKIKDF